MKPQLIIEYGEDFLRVSDCKELVRELTVGDGFVGVFVSK